jgi:hypothetical protein
MPFARGALRSALILVTVFVAPPLVAQSDQQCLIKGNVSSKGERIYHPPGCRYYSSTVIDPKRGERWFCSEQEAVAAGWRRTKVC